MNKQNLKCWLAATCAGFLLISAGLAQITTGTVSGTVFDETGAVLPGVTLAITNTGTNQVREVLSGENGSYRFPLLQPGLYSLRAELPGFDTLIRHDIIVETNQVVTVDLTMKPGTEAQTVEVRGFPSDLRAESSEVGGMVDHETVVELPLNQRNFIQLVALQPGASSAARTPAGTLSTAGRFGGQYSVHGTPVEGTAFLVDGIEMRDLGDSRISFQVTIDSIQEFKFQATNYSAAFARASGGVVNVTTRAGTQNFHGTFWEFLRNDNLDARNFFDRGQAPEFRRNQFGAALDGPLTPGGRVRFFASYEGFREGKGVSQGSTVPTLKQRQGDFSEGSPVFNPFGLEGGKRTPFPGNVIPANLQSPIARKALDRLFPLPDQPGLGNNLIRAVDQVQNADQVSVRLDSDLTQKMTVFGRFTYSETARVLPWQLSALPNFLTDWDSFAHNAFVAMNYTISTNTINELKYGFNRHRQVLQDHDFGQAVGKELGIQGLSEQFTGNPIINISGFSRTGSISNSPNNRADNSFHLIDNLTHTAGAHNLATGLNIDWNQMNGGANANAVGSFTFDGTFTSQLTAAGAREAGTGNAVADFLLGVPRSTSRCCVPGDGFRNYRSISFGGYVHDDWKISPRLTVNLGLRYELFQPPYERHGRAAQPDLTKAPNLVLTFSGKDGIPRGFARTDRNNWSPRIGFAYRIGSQTVVRGGYGIFYQFNDFRPQFQQAQTPPFVLVESFTSTITQPQLSLNLPFPSGGGIPSLNFQTMDPNFRAPYIQSWNLAVSREVPALGGTVLTATYVGNKGTKLILFENINSAPAPGPGAIGPRRPIPSISGNTLTNNRGKSNYHGLEIRGERRFAQDVGFQASYTWSHCIDVGGIMRLGDAPGAIRNHRDNNSNRGNCETDIRNRAVASFMYDFPFKRADSKILEALFAGWGMRSIITLQDGSHFTAFLGTDNSNTGGGANTPDPVAGQDPNKGPKTVQKWFNTAAFQRPPAFTYGLVGRSTLVGPGTANVDLSLQKSFALGSEGKHRLNLRLEGFNMFNRPDFFNPNATFVSPAFGVINRAGEAREFQFGLKYQF